MTIGACVLVLTFSAVAPNVIPKLSTRSASVSSLTPTQPGIVPDLMLGERLTRATDLAQARGAEISIAIFDRSTGVHVSNGNTTSIETASVSKLFIADDILLRESEGALTLTARDRALIDSMLRSSDDSAAEELWMRFGRTEIIDAVTSRYQLSSTSIKSGADWWQTRTTMSDVVLYYSRFLDGSGGLPADRTSTILHGIGNFTDTGTDGYYQRFGIPDALGSEGEMAVKQGWMCCIAGNWVHLSTGVVGDDHRYVVALSSRETIDTYGAGQIGAAHARQTITNATALLFPRGRVEL